MSEEDEKEKRGGGAGVEKETGKEKIINKVEGTPPEVDTDSHLAYLRDPNTINKINYILSQHGVRLSSPILRLEVEAPETCELEADDIQTVFSHFGNVENVQLVSKGMALVHFKDVVSAHLAQQALNNYTLPSLQAKLNVKWYIPPTDEPATLIEQKGTIGGSGGGWGIGHTGGSAAKTPTPLIGDWDGGPKIPQTNFMANNVYVDPKRNTTIEQNVSMKYTCRFDIQIENDKEFQVARKLIGSKGCNMKKILEICTQNTPLAMEQVVKLRLRGRGSGFKEGPNQMESDEPLHLCISSRFYDKYVLATHLSQELIMNIYEEYKRFCQRTGKTPIANLHIKKYENISGRRSNLTPVPPPAYPTQSGPPPKGQLKGIYGYPHQQRGKGRMYPGEEVYMRDMREIRDMRGGMYGGMEYGAGTHHHHAYGAQQPPEGFYGGGGAQKYEGGYGGGMYGGEGGHGRYPNTYQGGGYDQGVPPGMVGGMGQGGMQGGMQGMQGIQGMQGAPGQGKGGAPDIKEYWGVAPHIHNPGGYGTNIPYPPQHNN